MATVNETIEIAEVSQYLVAQDTSKGNLWSQRKVPDLAMILYMERKAIQWKNQYQPSNTTDLPASARYVLSLCRFVGQAQNIINNGGGGSVVPGRKGAVYPFFIFSSDFESDGVSYNNPNIVGDDISLFANQWSQQFLLAPDSFIYTATGFKIVLEGFDARSADYTIQIDKRNTG